MIKAFKPEHLELYQPLDTPDSRLGILGDLRTGDISHLRNSITMSVFNGGDKLLGVGGVLPFWKGVGEGWMLLTPAGRDNPMTVLKDVQWYLNYLFEKENFHRIQCVVMADYPAAHRFVLKCGFIPEGMMANYGPGKELFTRYVRFGG